MSSMNALHLHEVAEPAHVQGTWWEEHSSTVITIVAIAAGIGLVALVATHWEWVRDVSTWTFQGLLRR